MGVIDIRKAIEMRAVSELLLEIAKEPLEYVDSVTRFKLPTAGGRCICAAELARQASAAIISNCVVELWSTTVCYLHALEPDFPLYPKNVIKFVEETRLPFMAYISLYYSLCKKDFEGTSTHNKAKIIVDMRHEFQHDKPETSNEFSGERLDKVLRWRKKLEPLVGKKALLWLPKIRESNEDTELLLGGEPPIMKFMKYPIAKWALESVVDISEEFHDMLVAHKGRKKSRPELHLSTLCDKRFQENKDLLRLWQSGK